MGLRYGFFMITPPYINILTVTFYITHFIIYAFSRFPSGGKRSIDAGMITNSVRFVAGHIYLANITEKSVTVRPVSHLICGIGISQNTITVGVVDFYTHT